jgi:glycosyltransferase involved in cell wall biosynthesis
MHKIRILHLAPHLNFGGAEIMIRNLVKHTDGKKFKPMVATWLGGGLADHLEKEGVTVLRVPARPKPFRWWALRRLIRREKIDILHTHLFTAGFYGRLAAMGNRRAAVIRTHHGMTFKKKALKRMAFELLLYPLSSCHTAVSQSVIRHLHDTLKWKPAKMRLIQNGVDVERFCTDRDTFDELATILAAGRLSREKGFDILVEALHLLAGKRRYFKCLIAGDGPEKASLLALRDNLGLGDKIEFLGYVRDIAPLMKTCDLLVLPSRHEGLPLSLLEAMASGLPVVASAVGGIPDLLTPDKGWVVPPANPEVLADTIATVLDNPDRALKRAQRGRAEVANDYDIKKTANQYEDLYLELCQRTGVVGRAPKGGLRG